MGIQQETFNLELKIQTQTKELEAAYKTIQGLNSQIDRLKSQIQSTNSQLTATNNELAQLKDNKGIQILNEELKRFKATAQTSLSEFKAFLTSVNLNDVKGSNDKAFNTLFKQIEQGSLTASQAILQVKTEYRSLIEQNYNNSAGLFDSQSVQQFATTLEQLGSTMNLVLEKVTTFEREGVKAVGSVGSTGGGITNILKQIETATAGMTAGAKSAYEPITNLLGAMTQYANLDETKLLGVSQAFRNIADIGAGSYGTKSIDNIIYLAQQLQTISANGTNSIRFDFTGLNELRVSKASLNNLATYLPQIEKVNASKLKALSNVDLTNFNNIKVSKGSLEAIAQLTQALQLLKETKAATTDVSNGAITIDASNAKAQTEALSQASQEATRATQEEIANVQRLRQETENLTATTQNRSTVQSGVAQVASHQAKQEVAETKAKEAAVKQYYIVLTQIETAIKNYTSAEHSSKNGSKEAYAALIAQRDALRQLSGAVSSGTIKTDALKSATSKASETLKASTSTIKANGDATKTWSERIGTLGAKFGTWFSITRVIMYVIRAIRQMISASVELDSAMGQMQIVTKSTESQMNKFADSAANAAKRIGSSITDFVSSATTFARLGYNMDESSHLAEFTAMLQNVGDIDVKDAQDAITSIVKAFDIGTDQIESVMDKLVEVGNNYPVSVSDLAQGMTNASSALAAAGNSFEQSIALLTAANTTINLCRAA